MRVNFLLGLGFVQLEDLSLFLPSKIQNVVYIFTLQLSRYLASVTWVTCSITLPLLLLPDTIGSKQGNCCSIYFTGHMSLTSRTPPVSPPQPSFTTGLRRVYSLELRPHLVNSPDSGLADPLLGSLEASGSSEHNFLPRSTIYNWSCDHFSKPLLTLVDDSDVINTKREEREKYALDHISKCQHFCASSSFFCLVLV